MNIQTNIRSASLADAELLTGLAARTFYDAFFETNTPENMQDYLSRAFTMQRVMDELSDPNSTFLIAEIDGEPAGYAKLKLSEPPGCVAGPRPIEIVRLYVEQKHLGNGVGGALMQACLDEARRVGYQTIYLGVWERNPRAQAFYRKWGFEVVGSHVFQMGDDPQTDLWMERSCENKRQQ